MGQPTPPGDLPLIEGLDPGWNEFVSAIPEDRRAELGPKLKERVSSLTAPYEPLKPWEEFTKAGITPEQAKNAVDLYAVIENKPREVYDLLGKHLGVSPQEVKEAVEEATESGDLDPRIQTMQKQIETVAKLVMAQNQQTTQEKQVAQEEAALAKEMDNLKKKYSDVNEEEIMMRMYAKGLSAEDAYKDYDKFATSIRQRRPAPMILGGGGQAVPPKSIDPTKLDNKGTKDLVAQLMQQGLQER